MDYPNQLNDPSLRERLPLIVHKIVSEIQSEAVLTKKILKGNAYATMGIGTIVSIANLLASGKQAPMHIASTVVKCFLWFFGYGYFFDISDQIQDLGGDVVNSACIASKKDRPIASGELSHQAARIRQMTSGIYFWWISGVLGGLPLLGCALSWSLVGMFYSKLGDHFVTKNYVSMAVGSITMLLGARILTGRSWLHIPSVVVSLWNACNCDVQDFRDEKGDRIAGRKTMIVVLGERKTKILWASMVSLNTMMLSKLLRVFGFGTKLKFGLDGIAIGLGVFAVVLRNVRSTTAQEYDSSYGAYCSLVMLMFLRSTFL